MNRKTCRCGHSSDDHIRGGEGSCLEDSCDCELFRGLRTAKRTLPKDARELPEADRRSRAITSMITPREAEAIRLEAHRVGFTISDWVRAQLNPSLAQLLEVTTSPSFMSPEQLLRLQRIKELAPICLAEHAQCDAEWDEFMDLLYGKRGLTDLLRLADAALCVPVKP